MTARSVAVQDRIFLEHLSLIASHNRELINEARLAVGLDPDPIDDELGNMIRAIYGVVVVDKKSNQ
jgi:hypothetical protein